jgi:hypothetical protein
MKRNIEYKVCQGAYYTAQTLSDNEIHGKRLSYSIEDRKLFVFLRKYLEKDYDGLISLTLDKSNFAHEIILFDPLHTKIEFENKFHAHCPKTPFTTPVNQKDLNRGLKYLFKK